MSSEIQFGDLEQSEPQQAVRPDRDAHYSVSAVGQLHADQLPIFVDLDVMRDMEAHAQTNTNVELGGVMLGKQCVDHEGRPFVLVTDSLRAEHYEATRGSFKFTHETWQQISRQRARFHPELEMVGWYHTHPGWTVFLSPMDLFICNNFFNRPLDVALVIDPRNDDRGWFQWNEEQETEQTGGFYLVCNRYRDQELQYFSSLYNQSPTMNDPRYSGVVSSHPTTTTVVPMDNRKPWFDLVMVGMLLVQTLFLGMIFLKATDTGASVAPAQVEESQPAIALRAENQSLRLALDAVARSGEENKLAQEFVEVDAERKRAIASLEGQIALSEDLNQAKQNLTAQTQQDRQRIASLSGDLDSLRERYSRLAEKLEAAESATSGVAADGEGEGEALSASDASIPSYNIYWMLGGVLLGVLTGGAGMMMRQKTLPDDEPQREEEQ